MISRHFVRWTLAAGAILVVMSSPRVSLCAKPETFTKRRRHENGAGSGGGVHDGLVAGRNQALERLVQAARVRALISTTKVRSTACGSPGRSTWAHHVTVGQFGKFVDGHRLPNRRREGREEGGLWHGFNHGEFEFKAEYSWRNPGFEQSDEQPVVCVSWNDALAFGKWLSRKEQKSYRLPTEAEWEYACRGGTTTRYSFGNEIAALGNYVWYSSNSDLKTHAVGGKRPNGFGLYDMQGNACQWCADWYDEHYYAKSPVDHPKGPTTGSWHVARGGSFSAPPIVLRCASRLYSPSGRSCNFGFRVACER